MSFSTDYFPRHPELADDEALRGPVIDEAELERHAALIAPARVRLWLERGAALAAVLRKLPHRL